MPEEPLFKVNLVDLAADRQDVAQSVDDIVALGDLELRKRLVRHLMWLFLGLNLATILIVGVLAYCDHLLIQSLMESTALNSQLKEFSGIRVVTPELLMSLVGGTVVQVGSSVFLVTRYLFPSPKTADE